MNEYVKVLLCVQQKLNQEAEELEKLASFKAFRSYDTERRCEELVNEILGVYDRAKEYRRVKIAIDEIEASFSKDYRDAIRYRFHHGEVPKDKSVRTIYRLTIRAIECVANALRVRGFTKEWFMRTCGEDEQMMYLYHYYRSQMPKERQEKIAACRIRANSLLRRCIPCAVSEGQEEVRGTRAR